MMSPLFEQMLVFAVMSILVALFAWIYLLNRGREFGLWLVGWSAVCAHFAAPLAAYFLPSLAPLGRWIEVVAMVVAGTFFRLSVSEVFRSRWQRASFIAFVTMAATLYYSGLLLHIQWNWFYVTVLSATSFAVLEHGIRTYGLKSRYWQVLTAVLLPYWAYTVWRASGGYYQPGMDLYLFGLFVVTGMAYLHRFRRLTPGVVSTVVFFIAWGLTFPLSTLLQSRGVSVPRFLWDLPTYLV